MSGSSITVNNTLVDRFVDQRDRRKKELSASRFVVARHRRSQFFYGCTQLATIAPVDLFAFCVLTHSLLCRFMISHSKFLYTIIILKTNFRVYWRDRGLSRLAIEARSKRMHEIDKESDYRRVENELSVKLASKHRWHGIRSKMHLR